MVQIRGKNVDMNIVVRTYSKAEGGIKNERPQWKANITFAPLDYGGQLSKASPLGEAKKAGCNARLFLCLQIEARDRAL